MTQTKTSSLAINSTVVFTRVPAGASVIANRPYFVEAKAGRTVSLYSVNTETAIAELAANIERSEFHVQGRPAVPCCDGGAFHASNCPLVRDGE